jgi:hypothetical protein
MAHAARLSRLTAAPNTNDDWKYVSDLPRERRRELESKNGDLGAVATRAVSSA